jgi:hypothetical protein
MQKIFAALCNSNVLLGGHRHLPSKQRIGSTTAANVDQAGVIALHDFLPRCVFKSFASLVRAPPAAGADDDFRAMVNKKLNKVVHSLGITERVERLTTNWVAPPLDHCWQLLQKLDAAGHILRTLVHRDTSPFVVTVRQYTDMIVSPLTVGPLKALLHHIQGWIDSGYIEADDDVTLASVKDKLRLMASSLACQMTWRFVWYFEGNPFRAYLVIDVRLSVQAQLDVTIDIHGSRPCDLDPFFLRKASRSGSPYPPALQKE